MSEIEQQEEELRREIAEKQALAEAYRMVREDLAKKQKSNGVWPFGDTSPNEPAVVSPPSDDKTYGHTTNLVRWAISNMKSDYTIRTLRVFLRDHGRPLSTSAIAIVLSRFKRTREITEIRRGSG